MADFWGRKDLGHEIYGAHADGASLWWRGAPEDLQRYIIDMRAFRFPFHVALAHHLFHWPLIRYMIPAREGHLVKFLASWALGASPWHDNILPSFCLWLMRMKESDSLSGMRVPKFLIERWEIEAGLQNCSLPSMSTEFTAPGRSNDLRHTLNY